MADIAILTERTYDIVRAIPVGRVTSYGHIAKMAGYPNYSRHVGNAMKSLPPNSDIPWQRVISSRGVISPRGDLGLGVARQKERLEAEGVEVDTVSGLGERVDLRTYGWFPEVGQMGLDAWLAQAQGQAQAGGVAGAGGGEAGQLAAPAGGS